MSMPPTRTAHFEGLRAVLSRRQSECHLNERAHRLPRHRHVRVVGKWQFDPATRRSVEREVVTTDVDDAEQAIPALDGHPLVAKRLLVAVLCLADGQLDAEISFSERLIHWSASILRISTERR